MIKDKTNDEYADGNNADKDRNQLPFEHFLQDDDFRQGKGDDRHHKSEGSAERDALLQKHTDNGNDSGSIGIHRYAE